MCDTIAIQSSCGGGRRKSHTKGRFGNIWHVCPKVRKPMILMCVCATLKDRVALLSILQRLVYKRCNLLGNCCTCVWVGRVSTRTGNHRRPDPTSRRHQSSRTRVLRQPNASCSGLKKSSQNWIEFSLQWKPIATASTFDKDCKCFLLSIHNCDRLIRHKVTHSVYATRTCVRGCAFLCNQKCQFVFFDQFQKLTCVWFARKWTSLVSWTECVSFPGLPFSISSVKRAPNSSKFCCPSLSIGSEWNFSVFWLIQVLFFSFFTRSPHRYCPQHTLTKSTHSLSGDSSTDQLSVLYVLCVVWSHLEIVLLWILFAFHHRSSPVAQPRQDELHQDHEIRLQIVLRRRRTPGRRIWHRLGSFDSSWGKQTVFI